MPSVYKIHTQSHYKSWFSKDPDNFLPFENQLRFIETRQNNPKATLTFLYSSKCLNPAAIEKLRTFCKKHNINPVDFDTEIDTQDEPLEGQDKALYQIAQDEIAHTQNQTGGIMAAASDSSRLMVKIIEKYGIYSDFDVDIKIAQKPDVMEVGAPILLPASIVSLPTGGISLFGSRPMLKLPAINNETLIVAHDDSDPSKLHPEALEKIRLLQAQIIKNYSDTASWITAYFSTFPFENVPGDFEQFAQLGPFVDSFVKQNPHATIYDFRKHIDTFSFLVIMQNTHLASRVRLFGHYLLTNVTEEQAKAVFSQELEKENPNGSFGSSATPSMDNFLRLLKHRMLTNSVISISGPQIYTKLLDFPAFKLTAGIFGTSVEPASAWNTFISDVEQISLSKNNLTSCFQSSNQFDLKKIFEIANTGDLMSKIGTMGDQSWTPIGEKSQQSRHEKMIEAADTLTHAWRHRKTHAKRKPEETESNPVAIQTQKRSKLE